MFLLPNEGGSTRTMFLPSRSALKVGGQRAYDYVRQLRPVPCGIPPEHLAVLLSLEVKVDMALPGEADTAVALH